MSKIILFSGHFPSNTFFPKLTRKTFEEYCKIHNYKYYYEESEPLEKDTHSLHFRRSLIIQKVNELYPDAEWYVSFDSDVYVNNKNIRIEDKIDLSNNDILYHLFHERPWGCYPINTGVKFVNKKAIEYEKEIWRLRNTDPWNTFPFEQKVVYEYILPKIPNKYIIHDPYVLNCMTEAYPDKIKDSLFTHMCGMSEQNRNEYIKKVINT